MPRSAATILGLVLVADSIGLNTVRYPVVWEMVNPMRASETARPATTAPAEKPDGPAPAPVAMPLPPVKPIEVKPVAEVTDKIAVDSIVSTDAKPAGNRDVADDSAPMAAAEPDTQKPLVPVTPVANGSASGTASGAGIRRLPPITQDDSTPARREALQSLSSSIPVYPTTGIE
jgi:hypothetical protein